uniref:Uncharacterized protein n=1 Tax=Arundo donax TaxID=35708 RepID=A0A0A9D957_ARUDO
MRTESRPSSSPPPRASIVPPRASSCYGRAAAVPSTGDLSYRTIVWRLNLIFI